MPEEHALCQEARALPRSTGILGLEKTQEKGKVCACACVKALVKPKAVKPTVLKGPSCKLPFTIPPTTWEACSKLHG